MKNKNAIPMIITLSLFFITASFAQLIKPSKENDEHIQYYNSIKKVVLNRGNYENENVFLHPKPNLNPAINQLYAGI